MLSISSTFPSRSLTSWPTLQDDIRNAGGSWIDQEVCIDGRIVSSRKPADLPAFNASMVEVFAIAFEGVPREAAPASS